MATPGRVPPQAIELEKAILGAMIVAPEFSDKVFSILKDSSFYNTANREIFGILSRMYEDGKQIDYYTVVNALKKRKKLKAVGGSSYVRELCETVTTPANLEYHADIVRDKSILRKLITIATEIIDKSYDDSTEVQELLDWVEKEIFSIAEERLKGDFVRIGEIVHERVGVIKEYHTRGGAVFGIPTGFEKLDEATGGFHNSEFIVIGGRPGMGKSTLALSIMRYASVEHGRPSALFSLEMSKEQVVERLLTSVAKVDHDRMRKGYLSERDMEKIVSKAPTIARAPIFIDDTPSLAPLELRAKARRLKRAEGVEVIFVDYLQLMSAGRRTESRQQEISLISRSLKALARELSIPIVALSQLSRDVEKRPTKERRPRLSDLRESGAIEQDADLVMFIYDPKARENANKKSSTPEIIIAKQRNGPLTSFKLTFLKEYSSFENYIPGDDSYAPEDIGGA
ncbi:MAG: replicative DNA helicase [candidate division Zixibacteria bacterium 4484_93]|nr:MAG: replicative DNA helicase [candidate division Zixibacteria bacterium 4484_93]